MAVVSSTDVAFPRAVMSNVSVVAHRGRPRKSARLPPYAVQMMLWSDSPVIATCPTLTPGPKPGAPETFGFTDVTSNRGSGDPDWVGTDETPTMRQSAQTRTCFAICLPGWPRNLSLAWVDSPCRSRGRPWLPCLTPVSGRAAHAPP